MKRIAYLCIILVFLITSCAVKTTIDPETQQKVKMFSNEDISLYYPKNWKIFQHKFIESNALVSFSRYSDIIYPKTKKDEYKPPYAFNYVAIYKDMMPFEKFENYIDAKKQKIIKTQSEISSNFKLDKLTDQHYLLSYDTNPSEEQGFKRQFFLIHYIYSKDAVYEIELIAEPEKYQELLSDYTFILKSLKFK